MPPSARTDRDKIVQLLNEQRHLFANIKFDENDLFKFILYRFEIQDISDPVIHPLSITAEEFYISDEKGQYVPLIYHKIENRSAIQYCVDLKKTFSHMETISEFSGIRLPKIGRSRSVFAGILAAGERPLEYDIGNMMVNFFKHIRLFPPSRRANPFTGDVEVDKLLEDGSNLNSRLHTIQSSDNQKFRNLFDEINKIVSIKDITTPARKSNVTIEVEEEGLTSKIDLDNMSYGLQQTWILLLAIIDIEPDETICIEEPEIHLHANSQKKIFDLIHRSSKHNQFFFTTHSSIFTDIGTDVATYLITKAKGISRITSIENRNELKFIKQQLGIQNSDIYGKDYVIFYEGDSEDAAFSRIFLVAGYTQIEREVRLVNLKGKDNVKKIRYFLSYLRDFGTKSFIITDHDEDVRRTISDYVREGLLEENHYRLWPRDFEDMFDSQRIVSAMGKLSKEKKFKFEITNIQLEEQRKTRSVVQILKEHMYNTNSNLAFNKVDLAKELSNIIELEILSGNAREETCIEKEIKQVMDVILESG